MDIRQEIEAIRQQFLKKLQAADQAQMLEQLRVNYLGKKGRFKQILKSMGNLPGACPHWLDRGHFRSRRGHSGESYRHRQLTAPANRRC